MFEEVRKSIKWQQKEIKLFGRSILQPRLVCWMGSVPYTYSGTQNIPYPIPPVVAWLKQTADKEAGVQFNSVLANLYRDRCDSVAWHADDEKELGPEPVIASLSLGATRRFSIRRNSDKKRWDVDLVHGSLLIMSGRSQLDYQHCIPKQREFCGERINLTFRVMS